MLQTRIRTGFFLLLAGCLFLGLSHISLVLLLGLGVLSALAMAELAGPLEKNRWIMGAVGLGLGLLVCQMSGIWLTMLVGMLFYTYLMVGWGMMTALPGKKDFRPWETVLICLAVPVFLGTACHLRQSTQGLWRLLLPVLVCAATDTFAYFIGRRFGKQPLAPAISPKKTIEGAIGGGLLACAMVFLLGLGMECLGIAQVRMDILILYVPTASIVGQFGDLCLSAVKRVAGVKDFGDVLPGHGGILDRLDSCLLVLPYTFLFVGCFGGIFH